MLVCDICWEIYYGSGVLNQDMGCPKHQCSGNLADIDELLLPTIRVLNEKGYCTAHCCSGHFNGGKGESGYIQFQEDISTKMFKTLPKGTCFDPDSPNQVCLRWKFLGKDESSLHREIVKMSLDLLSWAEHLKPLQ